MCCEIVYCKNIKLNKIYVVFKKLNFDLRSKLLNYAKSIHLSRNANLALRRVGALELNQQLRGGPATR